MLVDDDIITGDEVTKIILNGDLEQQICNASPSNINIPSNQTTPSNHITFYLEIKSNGFNPLDIHRSNPIEAFISN